MDTVKSIPYSPCLGPQTHKQNDGSLTFHLKEFKSNIIKNWQRLAIYFKHYYKTYLTERVSSTSSHPLGSIEKIRSVSLRSLLEDTSLSVIFHGHCTVSTGNSFNWSNITQLFIAYISILHL